ncbi:MAG: hypothetical protein D6712_21035 [Chloroflexi bacterium]|nr:MAG: hypothetical protein D6712_21035 [Chloroflexota bacterium]
MIGESVLTVIEERHNVIVDNIAANPHVQIWSAKTNDLMSSFLPVPAGTFAEDQLLLVVVNADDGTFVNVIIDVYLAPPFDISGNEVGLREIQVAAAQMLPLVEVQMIAGGLRLQTPQPIAVSTENEAYNRVKEAFPYLFTE